MTRSTIAALLTPPSSAALSVLGLVGPRASDIAEGLFRRGRAGEVVSGTPAYGWFGRSTRDDVVVSFDDSAGEQSVEICCHGGGAIAQGLLTDLAACGAEVVDWRTFEHRRGRSEFQCDALEHLARAVAPKTATVLVDQLNGALDAAAFAASLDPSAANEVLHWVRVGRLIERAPRVVLFGLPNAGKSTLFNAIAGYSRVVTSPTAGTTRDVVSETIAIDGWPIELVDGAGLAADASPLEAEGGRRLTDSLATADLRVFVEDITAASAEASALKHRFQPDLHIANKIDLGAPASASPGAIACSATTGEGIERVLRAVIGALVPETPPAGAPVPFLERHRTFFERLSRPSGA